MVIEFNFWKWTDCIKGGQKYKVSNRSIDNDDDDLWCGVVALHHSSELLSRWCSRRGWGLVKLHNAFCEWINRSPTSQRGSSSSRSSLWCRTFLLFLPPRDKASRRPTTIATIARNEMPTSNIMDDKLICTTSKSFIFSFLCERRQTQMFIESEWLNWTTQCLLIVAVGALTFHFNSIRFHYRYHHITWAIATARVCIKINLLTISSRVGDMHKKSS